MLAGSVAGLIQDALASNIIGIGGLAKSIVGFVVGAIGQQFIVTAAIPRLLCSWRATAVHALLFQGLYVALGLRTFSSPWAAVATQALGNTVVGMVAFATVESLPGVIERRRLSRRPRLTEARGQRLEAARITMSVAEDRRRVALRLNVLQWGAVGVFTALAHELLVPPGRPARQVRGDGREQPPADARAAGAARRAVRPQRHRAGREPALVHHLDRPRALEGPDAHGAAAVAGGRTSTRQQVQQIVDRHRAEPSYRPIVVVEDATLAQVAAVTRAPPRHRAARRGRRGSADAALSGARRWRRTSSATSARPTTRRWRPARRRAPSSASRGSRRPTTTC